MVNVPGNQFFLLKRLVHSKPGEKQFQINLLQHHSRGYLDSNFQKFTKTTPLSWPQECRCLSHFPLAMWGTSSPYIQSCKQAKSCHFLWAKGGKELRDGMHRITYHLLCHYVLPAFWRHKRFNALFIFSSQECGQNLMCVEDVYLDSLPQHSPQSFKYVVGKENWFALQLFILCIEFSLVIVYLALKCSPFEKWAFAYTADRTINWYNILGEIS